MLNNKLEYLLASSGIKQSDYARHLNRSRQSVNAKIRSNTFSIADVVDIANLSNHQLVILDGAGNLVFRITEDDLKEKESYEQ